MGFDLLVVYHGNNIYNGYLSYNHSIFSKYWYVKVHFIGHKVSTALRELNRAINELKTEGILPQLDHEYGCWSPTKETFLWVLESIHQELSKLPRNGICQTDLFKTKDSDIETELDDESDEEEKKENYVVPIQCRLGTKILHNRSEACELYYDLSELKVPRDELENIKRIIDSWPL